MIARLLTPLFSPVEAASMSRRLLELGASEDEVRRRVGQARFLLEGAGEDRAAIRRSLVEQPEYFAQPFALVQDPGALESTSTSAQLGTAAVAADLREQRLLTES